MIKYEDFARMMIQMTIEGETTQAMQGTIERVIECLYWFQVENIPIFLNTYNNEMLQKCMNEIYKNKYFGGVVALWFIQESIARRT